MGTGQRVQHVPRHLGKSYRLRRSYAQPRVSKLARLELRYSHPNVQSARRVNLVIWRGRSTKRRDVAFAPRASLVILKGRQTKRRDVQQSARWASSEIWRGRPMKRRDAVIAHLEATALRLDNLIVQRVLQASLVTSAGKIQKYWLVLIHAPLVIMETQQAGAPVMRHALLVQREHSIRHPEVVIFTRATSARAGRTALPRLRPTSPSAFHAQLVHTAPLVACLYAKTALNARLGPPHRTTGRCPKGTARAVNPEPMQCREAKSPAWAAKSALEAPGLRSAQPRVLRTVLSAQRVSIAANREHSLRHRVSLVPDRSMPTSAGRRCALTVRWDRRLTQGQSRQPTAQRVRWASTLRTHAASTVPPAPLATRAPLPASTTVLHAAPDHMPLLPDPRSARHVHWGKHRRLREPHGFPAALSVRSVRLRTRQDSMHAKSAPLALHPTRSVPTVPMYVSHAMRESTSRAGHAFLALKAKRRTRLVRKAWNRASSAVRERTPSRAL